MTVGIAELSSIFLLSILEEKIFECFLLFSMHLCDLALKVLSSCTALPLSRQPKPVMLVAIQILELTIKLLLLEQLS